MLADKDEYPPTPVVSHALVTYNRGRDAGLADGIVITPSHNPPDNGGFKYNPPNGGPYTGESTDHRRCCAGGARAGAEDCLQVKP